MSTTGEAGPAVQLRQIGCVRDRLSSQNKKLPVGPIAAVVAVIAVANQAHANGDVVSYRVRPGDTLPLVAAEFYGDHQHTTLWIMVANKLTRARKLIPGEKLWIPITREITTSKGDTFESLAKVHLGDSSRAPLLAEFNDMAPTTSLATGTAVVLPLRVTHTAAGPETLAQIAQKYFGDAAQAEMLLAYNRLEAPQLDKGDAVVVPNFRIRVRTEKARATDAAAMERRAQRKQANAEALAALPQARTAWLQADFAGVKQALQRVATRLDFLEADTAAEVGTLLGKAAIAFDDTPAAIALFRQVLTRQPRELSTYDESPKVTTAWKQAGGRIRSDADPERR